MLTRNDKYSFIEQSFTTSENRFYNLSLNQSQKCATLISVQSNKSKPNNDKYCGINNCCCCSKKIKSSNINRMLKFFRKFVKKVLSGTASADFLASDNYKEKEKLQSWKKSSKISTFKTFNEDNSDFKEWWKNENILNTTNKSTLSLHIAAYENPIASDFFDDENIAGLKKETFGSIKKRCFAECLKSPNPFEFPRQQNGNQRNKPEVMQFKTSQKLLGSSRKKIFNKSAGKMTRFWFVLLFVFNIFLLSSSLELPPQNQNLNEFKTETEEIFDEIEFPFASNQYSKNKNKPKMNQILKETQNIHKREKRDEEDKPDPPYVVDIAGNCVINEDCKLPYTCQYTVMGRRCIKDLSIEYPESNFSKIPSIEDLEEAMFNKSFDIYLPWNQD